MTSAVTTDDPRPCSSRRRLCDVVIPATSAPAARSSGVFGQRGSSNARAPTVCSLLHSTHPRTVHFSRLHCRLDRKSGNTHPRPKELFVSTKKTYKKSVVHSAAKKNHHDGQPKIVTSVFRASHSAQHLTLRRDLKTSLQKILEEIVFSF